MTVQLPQFLNLDGEYGANALGLPFRYLVTEGITTEGSLEVTQNGTPNMSVNVAAGIAFVLGDDDPDQQPNYLFFNDGDVNVALDPADVTNDRIDIIVAQVRDSVFSGANDDARLIAITGTPAGSPSAPALPNNCLLLAEVLVENGETTILNGDITDSRVLATPGGELANAGKFIVVCTSGTRPAHSEGQIIYETNTDRVYASDGAAWNLIGRSGPAFSATFSNSVAQTITTGIPTKLQFTQESYDTDGLYDNSVNYRFTPNLEGIYHFDAAAMIDDLADGAAFFIMLYKNGAEARRGGFLRTGSTGDNSVVVSADLYMNGSTDYVEVFVNHNHGSNRNIINDADAVYFDGHFVRQFTP